MLPFVDKLVASDSNLSLSEQEASLPPELWGACVITRGEFTPEYKYIAAMRAERERSLISRQVCSHIASESKLDQFIIPFLF